MRNLLKKIPKPTALSSALSWVFPVALFLISAVLCFKSFTPNTFLTGWDTLHPEFNFNKAFETTIWGVWRSDQGLGAIAAHSHMSELPRLLYLLVSSYLMPLSALRYSYIFLCLILGPLGMFVFLKRVIGVQKNRAIGLASFVGASYYLLNLSVVSRFAVPFEMFTTQFAILPWVFLCAFLFIKNGKNKFLILFALTSLAGAPQAYAATLFYVYAFLFILSLFFYVILDFKNKTNIKKLALIVLTLFATNAFWLLPNLYSIKNQSSEVSQSKINQLFTPEAVLHNKSYGSFLDVISHKSYLFSWKGYDFSSNQFVDLLASWNTHLSDPRISVVPLVFAALSLLGFLVSVYKQNKVGIAFIAPTVLSLFFLMNTNGPFGGLYRFLQDNSSLFAEGLRDSFTKFSNILSFFVSFYIAVFLGFIFTNISKIKYFAHAPLLISLLLLSSLLILTKPAFKDGLVSPLMRVTIPNEYFESYSWFKGKEGRIAQLPLNSMWGWQYNSWGYQGAGFFWFGVKNPYLTRDFDRWSGDNESFYSEAARAYYSSDAVLFDSVLNKYKVAYLVLDGSIIDPASSDSSVLSKNVKKFLEKSKSVKKVSEFGFISIYQTTFGDKVIYTPPVYTKVNTNSTYSKVDYTFSQYGDYVSSEKGAWKPFVNFDSRAISLEDSSNWITLTAKTKPVLDQVITIPDIVEREGVLPLLVSINKSKTKIAVRFSILLPKISVDNKEIEQSPIYLTTTLLSNNGAGFLAIEKNVFDIENVLVDSDFHEIGTVYVNAKGKTKVELFAKQSIKNSFFLNDILGKNASLCNDPNKEMPLTTSLKGFSLKSSTESVCVGSLVSLARPVLYETSFTSPTGTGSLFCLNEVGKDGCINVLPPTATEVFGGRKFKFVTPLEKGRYWFAFVSQSVQNKETVSSYEELELKFYPQISSSSVDFGSNYGLFSEEKNIPLEAASSISISFYAAPIISENFLLQRGHPKAVNCDPSGAGSVSQEFSKDRVAFAAQNGGVACGYFDYPQLLQTQAYLLTLSGENSKGRGMKFYLQNTVNNHMDMEELLPTGVFSRKYVIEPFNDGFGGYVLNLETKSFEAIESKNVLTEISFAPIPLKWLTEIAIGPTTNIVSNNNLEIKDSHKLGNFINISTNNSGILSINEAYEKGWVAFSFKAGILKHLKVNGWENGWDVPENTNSIHIFYAPALLEFAGFGILLVVAYKLIKTK